MTAPAADRSAPVPAFGPFTGLGALVRKDVTEWLRGRRAVTVFIVSTLVMVLGAANAWIVTSIAAGLPPDVDAPQLPESLAPLDNLVAGIGTQIFILAAIFAVASLIARERESGTLAWVASKPVSREAIWVAKLLSSTAVLAIAAVLVPLAITIATVIALYGQFDLAPLALVAVGGVAVVALYAAIGLAAATVIPGQPAVAAAGFLVFFIVPLIAGIFPIPIGPYLPTSIFDWSIAAAMGAPVGYATPIAWAIGMAVIVAFALVRMRRIEL